MSVEWYTCRQRGTKIPHEHAITSGQRLAAGSFPWGKHAVSEWFDFTDSDITLIRNGSFHLILHHPNIVPTIPCWRVVSLLHYIPLCCQTQNSSTHREYLKSRSHHGTATYYPPQLVDNKKYMVLSKPTWKFVKMTVN